MEHLSPAEEAIMKATFKATMLRAADIIERITDDDVLEKQRDLINSGMPLFKAACLDRAHLAAAWLRLCAEGKVK
jgi:hypothetical protein